MNMLYVLDKYQNIGHGKEILSHWEKQMKEKGYALVMTSSLANEEAQHFYRKSDIVYDGAGQR